MVVISILQMKEEKGDCPHPGPTGAYDRARIQIQISLIRDPLEGSQVRGSWPGGNGNQSPLGNLPILRAGFHPQVGQEEKLRM